ncbi:ABC transporter transmembrane domain-containing protein, partial [Aneurinibacillus aneurinilyticus]|uniref:ABC transporter transmembrane domain-containing protein n=1 Tax=Aneurinibacillus aneurinilyticus TaxID=1391 RepID=UPI003D25D823
MPAVKKQKGWRQFIHLVQQTKPSKIFLCIALLLSVSTTVVGLFVPLFTKNLINDFSLSSLSTGRIILLVSAMLIQALASGISIYLLNHIGQSVVAGIRERLWKKLLVLPVSYYDEPHLLIIHKVEERRCTRRRVPSSFSHKEETRPLCGARAGPAKHLGITGREAVAGRFRPLRHTL